jgi:hypothetical protein
MMVTGSFHHRIVDGVVAGRFLQELKRFLENPASNRVRTTSPWRAGPATIGLVDVLSDILKDFAPVWWVDPVLIRRPYDHNFGLGETKMNWP